MFAPFNPKALLFFAARLPQFIDRRQIGMQNLLLIFNPIGQIASACFMAYALAGVAIRKILGKSRHGGKVLGLSIAMAGVALLSGRPLLRCKPAAQCPKVARMEMKLVSRHRSSVGLRWPSKRIAALHRLPIQIGMGCAMRLALRSDGCAQPTTSDP
ncbi:hypothetical protein Veis_2056 [Verminephrobacter eiseniae EF01-2]|uniref:Uncharacterized protein n=2 Tax=Verminephrobacter eiseniae TaxID=364317 RepID=A1WJJ9_VEREI|nr:hypothetical protein Veis_2056 [Verminephrobacter eiseniae EF01-2]